MAGTTVKDDHEVENCFYEAAVKTGLVATRQRINSMHGIPKKIVIQTLWEEAVGKGYPELNQKIEITYHVFKQVLEQHYATHPVFPTEGTLETFAWLKSNKIKIALNTGFYREVVNIILTRLGWDIGLDNNYVGGLSSTIDLSLTPNETKGIGRPHPDMIFKAMEMLDISDSKNVVKIGDTPSDLQEGKTAGCLLSLAVTNGSHTQEELELHYNDGLLNSMKEFKDFLGKKLPLMALA